MSEKNLGCIYFNEWHFVNFKDLTPFPNIRILINGRHFSHFPQKLNTRLQEGD